MVINGYFHNLYIHVVSRIMYNSAGLNRSPLLLEHVAQFCSKFKNIPAFAVKHFEQRLTF